MTPIIIEQPIVAPEPVYAAASAIGDDLVEAFKPWITPDLDTYLRAIGSMFAQTELFADDGVNGPGWTILLDPATAPATVLPHLAMYVGERLPTGITETAAREWVRDAPNQQRGTLYSIFRAAQRTLTGQRRVQIREREGAGGTTHVDRLTVVTYTSETPNPAGVLADLLMVVPADIVLNYETLAGQTWADVTASKTSWNAVAATWPTWDEVRSTIPAGHTFTRPAP